MRLWTLHPRYLDSRGIVALWREGLLAQKALAGGTIGYQRHPQLLRFRAHPDPLAAISAYLSGVAIEAERRAYRFDRTRILEPPGAVQIEATSGQLAFEWRHLMAKLGVRSPHVAAAHATVELPIPHPLFQLVPGGVADWERGAADPPGGDGQNR